MSDLVFSCICPWSLCFSHCWMLVVPQTHEAFSMSGLTCYILKLEHCPKTSHGSSVKSSLKDLLLREVFLSSIPLDYFIFFMDLLIFEIAVSFYWFVCPHLFSALNTEVVCGTIWSQFRGNKESDWRCAVNSAALILWFSVGIVEAN